MAVSENTMKVLEFLKEHTGEMLTYEDVARGIGVTPKQVNPMITYWTREREGNTPAQVVRSEPVEVTVNDAEGKPTTKKVRYISYVN